MKKSCFHIKRIKRGRFCAFIGMKAHFSRSDGNSRVNPVVLSEAAAKSHPRDKIAGGSKWSPTLVPDASLKIQEITLSPPLHRRRSFTGFRWDTRRAAHSLPIFLAVLSPCRHHVSREIRTLEPFSASCWKRRFPGFLFALYNRIRCIWVISLGFYWFGGARRPVTDSRLNRMERVPSSIACSTFGVQGIFFFTTSFSRVEHLCGEVGHEFRSVKRLRKFSISNWNW